MRESKYIEFKKTITNTFLKTISAFINYGIDRIMFGIADDGSIKGISDLKGSCLSIENKINDNLNPIPEYTLEINEKNKVINDICT